MDQRTGHTPMDFEYDNKVGQTSANSPWPQRDPNSSFSFAAPEPQKSPFRSNAQFPAPAVRLPQTPSKLPPTWREPDMGFSTDNQSSPENADNEETPDMPVRHLRKLDDKVSISRGRSPSKAKKTRSKKRDSILEGVDAMTNMFLFGPVQLMQGTGSPLQQRRRKRSRKEFDRDNQIYQRTEYSDWDGSRPSSSEGPTSRPNDAPVKEQGTIPGILSFLHQHPDLPHIISYWAQTIFSWTVISIFFYTVYLMIKAVGHEVELAVGQKATEIGRENTRCSTDFLANRCGPEFETVPALRAQCREWEDCMNRDPYAVGRGSISANTIASILNSFIEPLSWKFITTVVFCVLLLFSIPRALFGALSQKHSAQMQPVYPPPPQFPSEQYIQSPHQTGHQPVPTEAYYTPRHQRYGDRFEHDMSPSKRSMSPTKLRHESPSKRIGYM